MNQIVFIFNIMLRSLLQFRTVPYLPVEPKIVYVNARNDVPNDVPDSGSCWIP